MRALSLILTAGVATWGASLVDVSVLFPARAGDGATEITVAEATPSQSGDESLVYAVPPRLANAPVLPDLPLPLPQLAPDKVPTVDTAPPSQAVLQGALQDGVLQGVEHVSARIPLIEHVEYGAQHRRVTARALVLHSGPSEVYPAVTSLYKGEIAEVVGGRRAGWVPLRVVGSGKRGWAFHRFLSPVHG